MNYVITGYWGNDPIWRPKTVNELFASANECPHGCNGTGYLLDSYSDQEVKCPCQIEEDGLRQGEDEREEKM